MKTLAFGPGLLIPTLTGEKLFTIRKYRPEAHDFAQGEVVVGEFAEGFQILLRITRDTIVRPFGELLRTKTVAKREGGYWFNKQYFNDLRKYYSDLTWHTLGAVVCYEVLKIEDNSDDQDARQDGKEIPVVRLTKYGAANLGALIKLIQ